jgi:nucleotide-binding universal stress UspA family protein
MFKEILLAYDGSECAQRASEYAKELALKFDGVVTVLYAFHPIPRGWDPVLAQQARATEIIQGKASVNAVVENLTAAGAEAHGEVVEGLAADEIVKYARVHTTDLIIIGSVGPAPIGTFLLGRVSERVAHAAPCPVLIVR